MIRLHLRYLCAILTAFFLFFIFPFRSLHSSVAPTITEHTVPSCAPQKIGTPLHLEREDVDVSRILCNADGGERMQCLRDSDDIYFPFERFLKKRFDVSGRYSTDRSGAERFEWFTSYSRVRFPDFDRYDPLGAFGHFASYSVETRDRVRCISAHFGVPMSTQWSHEPYFYPIQIAQFALQHYSRNKTSGPPRLISIGDTLKEWVSGSTDDVTVFQQFDSSYHFPYTEVIAKDGSGGGANLRLNESADMSVVSFYWKPDFGASFTIAVQLVQSRVTYELHYVQSNDGRCVWHDDRSLKSFYYSLGELNNGSSEWKFVCRDVLVDLGRALLTVDGAKRSATLLHPGDVRGLYILFNGHSMVTNLTQRTTAHMQHFTIAADWFIANQNERGGWSVPVERWIADKRLVLRAGWHSAMAQGHALSVLTRAYAVSGRVSYLEAAVRALPLFQTGASEGGVRNELFGHAWFEEYPTTPGSFVLNGFMYALIGLYDLSQAPSEYAQLADKLFHQGLESLRTFLPLFDTGSGSAYDLRHLGLRTSPNLARWDYHTVHIYLLKWLFSITSVEQFNDTAERWASYAQGNRAKHN